MNSSPLIIFVLASSLLKSSLCNYVDVEILDGFGQVRLELGSHQKFECLASGEELNGSFIWSIGGQDLSNVITKEKVEDKDDPEIWMQKSSVRFTVEKNYHGKKLICKYANKLEGEVSTEILNEDSLSLDVYFLQVPDSVLPGHFQVGEDVRIDVEFGMFPRPEDGEVVWEMIESDGRTERFVPGEQSAYGLYSAKTLKDLGQDRYKASFDIVMADLKDNEKKFYLVVGKEKDSSRETGKRRVSLDFKIVEIARPPTPPKNMESSVMITKMLGRPSTTTFVSTPRTSEMGETTPLVLTDDEVKALRISIVSIIIVAIFITIIIFLVAYCLFCRKKEFSRVPAK